ncbi:MAG: BatD family protein [Candidatus Omnitrophica bacterium]|nr:BatD family protein [Candidatus Omnitrophota bacterium]
MKRAFLFFGFLFLVTRYGASAEEVQVSATVDTSRPQIDEEVSLTIQITGARGNLQAPRLPALQGFDSFYTGRSSQFTFVNGKSSSNVEFNYILVPKVAGEFTLNPIEVWIGGKSYRTQPIPLEVLSPQIQSGQTPVAQAPSAMGGAGLQAARPQFGSPPPPVAVGQAAIGRSIVRHRAAGTAAALPASRPSGGRPQLLQDENVFVKAWVDKPVVFPNEQVLLTYSLYTRYDTRYEGFEEEPSISGFWIEDFPLDRDLGKETVTVDGRRYVKADVRKIALFPTAAAQYTLQPGVLKISVEEEPKTTSIFDEFFNDSFFSGSGFFGRRVERLLKPEPLTVTVKPLPEHGKPASFNGAVGRFRIEASVDKRELKQNEPLTLKVVLEGEGNVETLPRPPIPELTGFKIYDGDSSSQLFKSGTTIAGKKTFEIIFVPTEAGELSIPSLEFSFFEPRSQNYQVLRTPSFPLQVAPSDEPLRLPAELAEKAAFKKEVQLEAKDIRFIHEELPSPKSARGWALVYRFLAVVNFLGLVLVGNGLVRRRRERRFSQDEALRRRVTARSTALRRLKFLKRLAGSSREEEALQFMEEAEKGLSEYFSNKFNLSAYHFTREWLEEKLTGLWGGEDPLLKEVRKFYGLASETRFARGGLPSAERRQYCDLIERVIRRLEKEGTAPIQVPPKLKSLFWTGVLLASFLFPVPGFSAPKDPAEIFREANRLYQAADYSQAASLYESLIDQGFRNSAVHYNLGNAYFKESRLGRAILHYERSRRLRPRDPDTLANLRYATSLLEYRIEDKRNWYFRALEAVLRFFTREEIGVLFLGLGVLFWGSWAYLLYFRKGAPWGWRVKTVLVFLVLASGLWLFKEVPLREAVVLKPKASVRYGPSYKDQVAFRLAEGMKVRLQKKLDSWNRVSLPNGETGWISDEEIEEI